MHTSSFFKLFPPPKFLAMKHAGLDISDDAIRCIEYDTGTRGTYIKKFASVAIPPGIIDGGDIKNEKALAELLSKFDHDNDLSYVKVSLPEEKAYLFQTDVPNVDVKAVTQHVEFKLEENVPLSATDAVFYFDLLPKTVTGGTLRASVSVVPRTYVEHFISLLNRSGIFPVAFEIVPKSIAKAIIPPHMDEAVMVVHVMQHKIGIYIVSGGVVCFTSTLGSTDAASLTIETDRVYTYWMSHGIASSAIKQIMLVGHGASAYEQAIKHSVIGSGLAVSVGDVWKNAFSLDHYIPPISKDDSLDYVVAAGLAMVS
jgi:Tfp pilus assembly PilM family ATPase